GVRSNSPQIQLIVVPPSLCTPAWMLVSANAAVLAIDRIAIATSSVATGNLFMCLLLVTVSPPTCIYYVSRQPAVHPAARARCERRYFHSSGACDRRRAAAADPPPGAGFFHPMCEPWYPTFGDSRGGAHELNNARFIGHRRARGRRSALLAAARLGAVA